MTWEPIKVNNVFADVKWFSKLKYGHILTVPLEHGTKPKCAYFVKDLNRIPDVLHSYDFFLRINNGRKDTTKRNVRSNGSKRF